MIEMCLAIQDFISKGRFRCQSEKNENPPACAKEGNFPIWRTASFRLSAPVACVSPPGLTERRRCLPTPIGSGCGRGFPSKRGGTC